ncbi:MAG: pkaF [Glaciihabitans sp.]|nr:pkaF [Glaciihabitans sp.]MDQ1569976.1 eukaryotic-like serine/threonine-protein kinase [Actinomycetota bacterium]
MIGRLIDGRYQVRSRIARGGMATVYLATDLRLERRVAIKIMHGHLADDSKFKERFIQEARSAARLAHPNVVNVFDQGQDSDMAYLVMEYLPGITLRDLLQENGKLTTDQTLDILEAVLSGLSAAHKAGIVHRDLKPENVLLADDGRIKIGDFGLARAASANTATGAALLGTIAYLSPELVTRGVADTRSDIYAVGIMTYEMLTGEQPFKGEQPMQIAYQHANDSVPSPGNKNPRVPAELDELVLWATAREPDERPRDARAMLDEVMVIQSEILPSTASASTMTQRTMVLPGPASTRGSTAETQVFASARRNTGPVQPTSVALLGAKSKKRRSRGWWLFALVLVIAAIAGGTGWYFNAGPGGHLTIPNVAGETLAQAQADLKAQGFVVSDHTGRHTDPTVPKDRVQGTSPGIGTAVGKDDSVTIILSDGPKQLPLPPVIGTEEAVAKTSIEAAGFAPATTSIQEFSSKFAKGLVIDDLDANGRSLADRQKYSEQRTITLVVSAGALPDVKGLSLTAAIARLKDVGLTGTQGSATYSDSVAKGDVIGIDPQKVNGVARVFRVNDSQAVLLITSNGPPMVTVPNVVGDTWDVAKAILKKAGFQLDYNQFADFGGGGAFTVQSVKPAAGQLVPKGSTLKIRFNGF